MPDAIAAQTYHATVGPHYFALGPIPPIAFITSLYAIARSVVAGVMTVSHVLTIQDTADVGAHAAGRRLLARAVTVANTQPAYTVQFAANSTVSWNFPLNLFLAGGANWIITYFTHAGALNNYSLLLSVGWLNEDEYARMYGLKVPVTIVGPPRFPGIPQPPIPGERALEPM